jgi:hypothetical protein
MRKRYDAGPSTARAAASSWHPYRPWSRAIALPAAAGASWWISGAAAPSAGARAPYRPKVSKTAKLATTDRGRVSRRERVAERLQRLAVCRRGERSVGRRVDAASDTGAFRPYERAGMAPVLGWVVYEKELGDAA